MTDKFDVEKSLGMPYFCYVTTDGKQYTHKIMSHFIKSLNDVCGTKFVVSRSVTRRNSFIVFYETEEKISTPEVVVEPEVTVEVKTEPENTSEDDSKGAPVVDLDKAMALYNPDDKKASKLALEAYGREFGVELNRAKTFDNMIKALKEKTS
jgi:hypothetical protein